MVVTEQRTSPKEIGETQLGQEDDRVIDHPIGRKGRKEAASHQRAQREEIGISHLLHPWVRSSRLSLSSLVILMKFLDTK